MPEAKLPSPGHANHVENSTRYELPSAGTATEFVLLLTPRGEIVTSAEGLTLGYGDDEFGHAIAERVHPDDLPTVLAVVERARNEPGFRETVHARGRRAEDRWGTFEVTVIDASRDLTEGGVVLRVRDVTDEIAPDLGGTWAGHGSLPVARRCPTAGVALGRHERLGRVQQRDGAADLQPLGRRADGPRLGGRRSTPTTSSRCSRPPSR